MEPGLVLSFIGASVLLTFMPGPDNIFVLTESLTKGQKNGILISIGLCLGVLVHTLAAATGLSIILQKSAMAFAIIKYFGAAYLLYLAYVAYKEGQPAITINRKENQIGVSKLTLLRKGFLMNVLNPKVSLFFIAFLPQFVSNNGIDIRLQMMALGAIFMVQALIIFSAIAVLSGRLTKHINNPKMWKITKWSKVGVLSMLGLTLAFAKK